jgi:hypothetical protein
MKINRQGAKEHSNTGRKRGAAHGHGKLGDLF